MRIKSMRQRLRLGTVISSLLLLAIAAPLGITSASAQDAQILTRVQFLHAGTDLGDVEVHLDGESTLDNFSYGDQSEWIEVDPGSVQMTMTADRRGFNYMLFNAVYPVPAGNDYFVVITDEVVITGVFDTSPVLGDGSHVQFTQASVDTPRVNVTVSGESAALATNLGFARTSDPAPLPPGTFDIDVTLADSGEEALSVPGVEIDASKSYVFVLMGDPGDDDKPLTMVILETDLAASDEATPVS